MSDFVACGRDGKIKIKMHDPEPTENVSGIFIRKIYPVETPGNKKLLQDNLHRRLPTLWLNSFMLVFSLLFKRCETWRWPFYKYKKRHNLVDFRIIEDEGNCQ
ncbi:hypothetical protein CEXT_611421 [Caerostris extrusa]|uniref:Uncharacterized protein n=1 Tax=Caerostris extrusa TaxID=172846 RepID=A0AAV4N3P4_CAEEX|nr:hypothetical protein CEXT_611421 [Caerostris extrusa]